MEEKAKLSAASLSSLGERSSGRAIPTRARFFSDNRHERYEAEKLAWIIHNPNASCRQYQEAMQAIALRYGL